MIVKFRVCVRFFKCVVVWSLCGWGVAFAASDSSLGTYVLEHLENSKYWNPFPIWKACMWDLSSYLWVFSLLGVRVDMSPSVHLVMIGFAVGGVVLMALVVCLSRGITAYAAPRGIVSKLVEPVVVFLRNEVCIANMGHQFGNALSPVFCTLFFFILAMNLIGLVPGMATATANVSVAAALACVSWLLAVGSGVKKYGVIGFFRHLCPLGVPIFLAPFLLVLEILGLFVRPFALMIRIFVNMLAGHIVLGSLLGILVLLKLSGLPLISMVLLIYLLEVFVAFMQAFIFVMLTSIFVGGIVYSSHE